MRYVLLLLFFSSKAGAQQVGYLIYLVKGDVTVKTGKAAPKPAKQNVFIAASDVVNLSSAAELTLADKEGNTFVLSAPGKYSGPSLAKQKKATNSLTQKYLGLLYHELLDPNHDYNKFHKNNLGGVWGGVNRGNCGNLLFPAQGMKTAGKTLLFKWRKTSKSNNYVLTLYDSTAKELLSLPVADTVVTLDVAKLTQGVSKYYWRIQGQESDCEDEKPLLFEIISEAGEATKITTVTRGAQNLAGKLNAVEQLYKEGYLSAAQKYFQSLLAENSDASLVKTYTLFLLANHLTEEAQKVWESRFGRQQ